MLYTPPVTPWESVIHEAGSLTFMEGAIECRTGDWGEVVTRYHYRKVGMDHLLSMEKDLIYELAIHVIIVLLSFERLFSLKK